MPHFEFTLLLALLLASIIAVTGERKPRKRLLHGCYVFLSAMVTVIAGSWIMRFIEM